MGPNSRGRFELSDLPTAAADGDGQEAESAPEAPSQPQLPVLDDAARSPDPTVCPFFRFELDGNLVTPLPTPDAGNRCAAIGSPRPQSERQQELVCLRAAHTDCPRYLKGALAIGDPAAAARRASAVPRATLAALLILVLSAGISFGFVVQRGGIELPAAAPGPTSTAIALAPSPSDEATLEPTIEPTVEPTEPASASASVEASSAPPATPEPTASPTLEPSPSPEPTPSPTVEPTTAPSATPTDEPTPKPTKKPSSDRYKLLDPCPDKPDCWIYVVRSGDNLYSIGHYFGIPLSVIYDWNPRYPGTRLRVGDQIRMPPPRR